MNLVQVSAVALTVAVCLGACSRREYAPFDQQGVVSGMTKVEVVAQVKALGFKINDETKLDEHYSMVDATYGKQLWLLGFCNDQLALTSSLVPTDHERMDKFLASYTQAYGKPHQQIATRDRSPPKDAQDFLMREVLDKQYDVTLTWHTPYGTAVAKFDHASNLLGVELKDTRVWQPCAPANR